MILVHSTLTIPKREIRFVYGTSTGPGGQHVNKVATKATLLFDISASQTISNMQRERIQKTLATRINKAGVLRVSSSRYRSQQANRLAAMARFVELISEAIKPKKQRKKTKVARVQKRKRLENKKKRGELKRLRGKLQQNDS